MPNIIRLCFLQMTSSDKQYPKQMVYQYQQTNEKNLKNGIRVIVSFLTATLVHWSVDLDFTMSFKRIEICWTSLVNQSKMGGNMTAMLVLTNCVVHLKLMPAVLTIVKVMQTAEGQWHKSYTTVLVKITIKIYCIVGVRRTPALFVLLFPDLNICWL